METRNSKLEDRHFGLGVARLEGLPSLLRRGLRGGALCLAFLFAFALLASQPASAQVATGFPPFGSFGGGPFDTVDNANLNVHFAIPIINKAGRGLAFDYAVTYDSSIWYVSGSSWAPVSNFGWGGSSQVGTGYVNYSLTQGECVVDAHPYYYNVLSSWYYYDWQNTSHSFPGLSVSNGNTTPCPPSDYQPNSAYATSNDGSGWQIYVQVSNQGYPSTVWAWSRSGVKYIPPLGTGTPSSGTYTLTDPNGNVISFAAPSTYTDTLGTTVLTIQGTPSSPPVSYAWSPPNGGTGTVSFNYTQETVQTNFGCSGVSEYGAASQYLVTSISLPDKTSYSITYEATPGNPAHVTGRIASVTLPTGGEITYTYNGIMCPSGGTFGMTRKINDNNGNNTTWTYLLESEYPPDWETVVTDPQGNNTDYSFSSIYETSRLNSLASVTTCYNGAAPPCVGAITLPITEVTVTPNLGGAVSETDSSYNSNGLVTKVDQYDFGSGQHGNLLRETMTCYSNSLGYILDRPSYQVVYSAIPNPPNPSDCSGTTDMVAKTSYNYDSYGNLLEETLTNTGGSPTSVSRSFTYNTNGTLNTATDFNNNTTTYAYASGSASCNGSFPTTITPAITSLTYELTWNCNGGVLTSIEDPNIQPTTYKYTDANFWRIMEIDYPANGKTTFGYNDPAPTSISTYRYLNSSTYHETTQVLDGLGRVIHSQDNTLGTSVDTAYDALGRVYSVSNPHTSAGEPSDGLTIYGYDVLNLVTSVEAPDGSTTNTNYAANSSYTAYCSTVTDPASKVRTLCSDGLGRITSVTEDPSGLNYSTTYAYDPLNDLTAVSQGSQTRTYNYDMLSRLTSVNTPEVSLPNGTQCSTTYGYDANGNLTSRTEPQPNQNSSCSTVTATYTYDALNRLSTKSYNDTPRTPAASLFYDQAPSSMPAWSGVSFSNAKGRLVLACTNTTLGTCTSPTTATAYSYDPVGRIANFWQCNPPYCSNSSIWNTQYNYDLAGDVTSWEHPGVGGEITLTNTINAAQQITAIQSSANDSTHPPNLAQNITYTPWGAVSGLQNGCVGSGCTVEQETYQYNQLLQPWVISLTAGSGGYCLVYNYYSTWTQPSSCPAAGSKPPTGTTDNGSVMNYWDSDSYPSGFSHTMSYTYDHLNRLATATAKSLGGSTLWSYAYSYDRWGNGTCTQGGVDCPSLVYNSNNNNQLATIGSSLFSYDAAGNLTTDPSNALATHTYQWDAEGRVSVVDPGSSPTWSFTYNAVGDRVTWTHSGSADQHIFDPAGNFLGVNSVWDLAWLGGRLVTVYLGSNTYFSHPNHLGSTTAWADYTGKQVEDLVFYPWGGVWQYSGSGGYMFAGMPYYETTTETSPANYRFYSMNVGRWHSPDPVGGDISNPQSLNRYAYVMNNHTTLTDPLGLGQCPPGTAGQGCNPEQASQSNWLGMGIDPFDECSYTNTVDASCALPPGLWENGTPIFGGSIGGNSVSLELGNVGGGFGTGPLSGDFGPLGYPSAGGWGPPCEFGSCGSGVPGLSGSGFEGVIPQEGVVPIFTSTVWACAFNPACLAVGGAIAVGAAYQIGTMYVSSLIGQAIGARILQAKGGSQNVGHDYIRDEARQLAKELNISYCEALQMIYQAARAAGNFKKANDTKATQKQDGCRGH